MRASEVYKNLPAGYYRDLKTSGQSMCSNGCLAIETSIKNLTFVIIYWRGIYSIYAPYLKQSALFPGNFIQIESEPTENGYLSEVNTSLRGYLNCLNKYLFKRCFITVSKAMSEELEVLDLTLSSIFIEKIAKKERTLAGIRRDRTGNTGSKIARLSAWTICELTNADGKRSLKSFRWLHAQTTGTRTADASARYAQTRRRKQLSKISKLISFCPGVYHKYNKSLALAFISWKKPRH